MSALSLQQIMSSRYRTSQEADRLTVSLMSNLGLSTKANVARLAISRSLSLGALSDEEIDAKGMEIQAYILFTQEDISVWVGLLVTHARKYGNDSITTMDGFRAAVRRHWHRGVRLLQDDWDSASGNFDKFLETLIVRRAELPDVGSPIGIRQSDEPSNSTKPKDESADLLKSLLAIGVQAEVKGVVHGPRISRYKVFLHDVNQFDKLRRGLERLALSLNLESAKPSLVARGGANTVSLDVPRPSSTWTPVTASQLKDWINSTPASGDQLIVYPGVDVLNQPYSFDLASAPHLLVGGTTGSGKSVCLHALILSLIMRMPASSLQLALIDPKLVEFSVYRDSDYLYRNEIATDHTSAREVLSELVTEMEARYQIFANSAVSNIQEARAKRHDLPYIVVFIEELADLLLKDKTLEDLIVKLAQKARAAGIHLVLATQRPDAKTFSGLIRSNIPARIALTVQKSTESNIILDDSGAEDLLGAGDMLVKAKPGNEAERVHGVRLSRSEIESILKDRSKR